MASNRTKSRANIPEICLVALSSPGQPDARSDCRSPNTSGQNLCLQISAQVQTPEPDPKKRPSLRSHPDSPSYSSLEAQEGCLSFDVTAQRRRHYAMADVPHSLELRSTRSRFLLLLKKVVTECNRHEPSDTPQIQNPLWPENCSKGPGVSCSKPRRAAKKTWNPHIIETLQSPYRTFIEPYGTCIHPQ